MKERPLGTYIELDFHMVDDDGYYIAYHDHIKPFADALKVGDRITVIDYSHQAKAEIMYIESTERFVQIKVDWDSVEPR
jgi:hypothetical protein